MKLVVEGAERIRKIVSVGVDSMEYVLREGQELRKIPDESWKGWRKSEISWDEEAKIIVEEPFPSKPEEIKQQEDAEYMRDAADKIRDLVIRVIELEDKITAAEKKV